MNHRHRHSRRKKTTSENNIKSAENKICKNTEAQNNPQEKPNSRLDTAEYQIQTLTFLGNGFSKTTGKITVSHPVAGKTLDCIQNESDIPKAPHVSSDYLEQTTTRPVIEQEHEALHIFLFANCSLFGHLAGT